MKPISPDEIVEQKKENIPDFVIECVNKLIAENYTNCRSEFTQLLLLARLKNHADNASGDYELSWLNFEEIYREQGWLVQYDAPAYNESHAATYNFTKVK